jgi:hypothetical protein
LGTKMFEVYLVKAIRTKEFGGTKWKWHPFEWKGVDLLFPSFDMATLVILWTLFTLSLLIWQGGYYQVRMFKLAII